MRHQLNTLFSVGAVATSILLVPQVAHATDLWCQSSTCSNQTVILYNNSSDALKVTNSGTGDGIRGINTQTGYGVAGVNNNGGGGGVYAGCSGGSICNGIYGTCSGASCFAAWWNGNTNVVSGHSYLYATSTCIGGHCGTSDRRLKKNVKPLADALDKLLQINGVTFEWINPGAEKWMKSGIHTGVIAQDVEKVFPEWVSEDEKGIKVVNPDARATLGITIEALRALKVENDALRAKDDSQDKRLEAQDRRIKEQDDRIKAIEDARRPMVSNMPPSLGIAVGGLAIAGALVASRRKREERR